MKTGLLLPLLLTAALAFSEEGEEGHRAAPVSRLISVGGVQVHYRELRPTHAPSQTLLLVHGWLGSSYDFVPLMEHLPADFRVVAVDLPGSGRSQKVDIPFSTEYFLDFLDAFARQIAAPDFVLVGHSMGGELAVRYAVRHPDRVTKLILIDPYGLSGEEGPAAIIRRSPLLVSLGFALNSRLAIGFFSRFHVFHDPALVTREYVDSVAETCLTADGRRAQAEITNRVLGREPVNGLLPSVEAPTLVIWGAEDQVLWPWWANRFAEEIPNARLVMIPDTGHMPQFEKPGDVAQEIVRFVRK